MLPCSKEAARLLLDAFGDPPFRPTLHSGLRDYELVEIQRWSGLRLSDQNMEILWEDPDFLWLLLPIDIVALMPMLLKAMVVTPFRQGNRLYECVESMLTPPLPSGFDRDRECWALLAGLPDQQKSAIACALACLDQVGYPDEDEEFHRRHSYWSHYEKAS